MALTVLVPSALGLATGLPHPSNVNTGVSSVFSVATGQPGAANPSKGVSVAVSTVSAVTSLIRDPITVPSGVVPNPIVVPSGSILSNVVSSVISGATGLLSDPISLPTSIFPSSLGADLPSTVILSVLAGAIALARDVSTLFTPLSQVSRDLENVSNRMPTLLGLMNHLGILTNLAGSVTTGLSKLIGQLNAAAASIQSLNSVLSGLSKTPTSAADAAQLLSQGSAIAQRIASLTIQMNSVVTGCHQNPTPINLTQLRSALLTLQTHLQNVYRPDPALRHAIAGAGSQHRVGNDKHCPQHMHPDVIVPPPPFFLRFRLDFLL
ncbi:hypothetical protein DFH09DRAFT_1092657 [Mycena vulgaris]|nr:hypothetical protein DFH09DRAFT_1092657 [Mycena vulgaris]